MKLEQFYKSSLICFCGEFCMIKRINRIEAERISEKYISDSEKALHNNDYMKSIELMNDALKVLKEAKCMEKYVLNLNILGIIYSNAGEDEKAFECYLEGLAMTRVMKNCAYLKALCYINVGSCYQKLERHDRAIQYFIDAQRELADPSFEKEKRFQMWNMVNYINLKDSYGMIGGIGPDVYNDKYVVFA